jgi:serine/threonine protein kinase
VAPEVLEQSGHSTPCDMWSLGVITYALLSGCMPFFSDDDDTSNFMLYQNIMKGRYDFPNEYWGEISHLAKDFITRLLVVDPSKRMTAAEALRHPWLQTTSKVDVLPNVRKNFNAKKTFKKAVLAIQTINKMSTRNLVVEQNATQG